MPGFRRRQLVSVFAITVLAMALWSGTPARATPFPAGSLIIPMDLTYQDHGMLQAFGLLHQLLAHGVPVYRIIDPLKVSSEVCDSTPQGCWWDCEAMWNEGPCPYPTFSPDLVATARVLWDDRGLLLPGAALPYHGYRGGPFLIHADDAAAAVPVIEAWNDPSRWTDEPWAARSGFSVVSVHELTMSVNVSVGLELRRAPRMAILADSREDRFARVLRAAGLRQTDGAEFEATLCAPGACGPGTARPDFLSPDSLLTLREGCVRSFTPDLGSVLLDIHGNPRYALLAAGGWTVARRDAITCGDGGPCATTRLEDPLGPLYCFDEPILEHGHQLLAHLSRFHGYGGSLLFMGEAAYAVENAVASYGPPVLDVGQVGHYLTDFARWPGCPCQAGSTCVPDGCPHPYQPFQDCCIPDDPLLRQAGISPGAVPDAPLSVSRPGHPVFQFDGALAPTTGPLSWMHAGAADATVRFQNGAHLAARGVALLSISNERVTLLGDFDPGVALPVSANPDTQIARLLLDALFAARLPAAPRTEGVRLELHYERPCTTAPEPDELTGQLWVFSELALELDRVELEVELSSGIRSFECDPPPTGPGPFLRWTLERVPNHQQFDCRLTFAETGEYTLSARLRWTDGYDAGERSEVWRDLYGPLPDSDGDHLPDCLDPYPDFPQECGDEDRDGLDDCTGAPYDDWDDDNGCVRKHDPRSGLCPAAVGGRTRVPGEPSFGLLLLLVLLRRRARRALAPG